MRNRTDKNRFGFLVLAMFAALFLSGEVAAQTTEFSYQR